MKRFIFHLVTLLPLIFFGCQEAENFTPRDYSFIQSQEIHSVDASGATIDFNIIDPGIFPIVSYGVEYVEKELFERPFFEGPFLVEEVEGEPSSEALSIRMETDLISGVEYVARPFIKSNKLTVYGEFLSFTAQGSKAPIISEVSSSVLGMRLEITIRGNNFSQRPQNNRIVVPGLEDYFEFEILESSKESLRVRVNKKILKESYSDDERYDLVLNVQGQEAILSSLFTVGYPRISQINTLKARVGDEIIVDLILEEEREFLYITLNYERANFLALPLQRIGGNQYRTVLTPYPTGKHILGFLMEGIYNVYPEEFEILED
ncbi:hypothetical protein E4S40_02190 [Algoriphagus kandeliae]|uniref:DUF4249 family protein n=1 Tax=Algoriphagus kandeliae TaxID=2562278 RepID=A0A4Y9QZC5_9BACT|nr:hypothetical protein [Algoriphagus kandeliae]TFV97487.1 hypothetical protein E4S40_02190 [Algoriphagus kandeliae]